MSCLSCVLLCLLYFLKQHLKNINAKSIEELLVLYRLPKATVIALCKGRGDELARGSYHRNYKYGYCNLVPSLPCPSGEDGLVFKVRILGIFGYVNHVIWWAWQVEQAKFSECSNDKIIGC